MVYVYVIGLTFALVLTFIAIFCYRCCRATKTIESENSFSSESSSDFTGSRESIQSSHLTGNDSDALDSQEFLQTAYEQPRNPPYQRSISQEALHLLSTETHLQPPPYSHCAPEFFSPNVPDSLLNSPPPPYELSHLSNKINQT